jgi:hypothetical protein
VIPAVHDGRGFILAITQALVHSLVHVEALYSLALNVVLAKFLADNITIAGSAAELLGTSGGKPMLTKFTG